MFEQHKVVSDSLQNIRRLASSGLGGDNFFQAAMMDLTIVHNLVPTYIGELDKFEELVRDTREPTMFRVALIHVMSDWRVGYGPFCHAMRVAGWIP